MSHAKPIGLTAALSAAERKMDMIVDAVYADIADGENVEDVVARIKRERDEAYRQNPILREQVRELQERLAVLDEAYRAVTEQLSRSATLAATAEVERDSLREQLARLDAAVYAKFRNGFLGSNNVPIIDAACERFKAHCEDAARKRTEEVTEES